MISYWRSGGNKSQKLVGRFSEHGPFCRLLMAFLLKIYSKFGQMLKLVGNGQWPAVISRTAGAYDITITYILLKPYVKETKCAV